MLGARRGWGGWRRSGGGLPAGGFLVGDGGAAVQLGVDEAAAAPDVVHTAGRGEATPPPLGVGVGEGEAGGVLLRDGGDALVA